MWLLLLQTEVKTFTKSGLQLVTGGVKFRVNNAWVTSWGGTTFPSGTGALNSNNNIPTTPGTYDVTFNRLTGEYAFTVSTLATGETVKKAKSFVFLKGNCIPINKEI